MQVSEGDAIRLAWEDHIEQEDVLAKRVVWVCDVQYVPHDRLARASVRLGDGRMELVDVPEEGLLRCGFFRHGFDPFWLMEHINESRGVA